MKKIIAIIGFVAVSAFSTASAAYFNNTPVVRCDVEITKTLQVGSRGNEVYTLQNLLARAGYLQATPNGNFGPATKQAVRSFQYDNSIQASGIVGEVTRNAINERLCDTDVNAYGDSYNYYGYNTGTTYVDAYDPYARVIAPAPQQPVVYQTPQNNVQPVSHVYSTYDIQLSDMNIVLNNPTPLPTVATVATVPAYNLSTLSNQIAGTNIIYSPYVGYTYGITPQPGTLTVTSPSPKSIFNEGDTVNVQWSTNNISASTYQVFIENTTGGQAKLVAVSNTNNASFVLTKENLDAVCSGDCATYQKDSYRIVISTPLTDIAGQTSTFKATVYPITIIRPFAGAGSVSLTSSRSPINSGEGFKLYVNIPTGASWNANLFGQYSFKIHALCPSNVQVSIAGVQCGNDFALPFTPSALQQEIPVMITNSTWFRQDVQFEMVVTNVLGQVIGRTTTSVTVNGLPFSW